MGCPARLAAAVVACSVTCSVIFGLAHVAWASDSPARIAPSVEEWLKSARADETIAVWVFFTDKGRLSAAAAEAEIGRVASTFDRTAVARRLRARPVRPFDQADLAVHRPYLDALKQEGVALISSSKWLNAAAVRADAGQIATIAGLPFVRSLRRVSGSVGGPEPYPVEAPLKGETSLYQYGYAWRQLDQIQIPALHTEGFTGTGIRVGVFDTGFWLEHETFAGLNLIAEHDFINDDDTTANQAGDPSSQHDHGTMCLSLLAGETPGTMMGGAFDAQYILAKTEDVADEQPIEEAWWIEALEWADSLGVQVISTSLSYKDWYTYADMDGDTAPITNAADQAAMNGIVVVAAAGNSGASSWRYIAAPADGDSVVTVGSVDSLGVRSYFSSQGPTYDGRIKPTIMAMGQADYIADVVATNSYRRGSGTSFATPLAAGAIALILEKHPNWLPENIVEAITSTGTRSSNPDTLCGWGILQARDASNWVPSSVAGRSPADARLRIYPNPCVASFSVAYPAGALAGRGPIRVYDVAGRLLHEVAPSASGTTPVDLQALVPRLAPGILLVDVPGEGQAKVMVLR
ncbi:MAG: S8 family serine peptidase [bacterium]